MQQKFWFHAFHWQLMSTVGSTASSDVQSLNSLQLVEQKLIMFNQSTPCSKSGFVFFVVLVFLCGFLTWWWWQNRHAYNPRQPMLYLSKSTMYLLSSFLRFTSIFVIKSTEVKDQLFDLVANYQLLASLRNQQYLLQCPSSFSFEWLLFL